MHENTPQTANTLILNIKLSFFSFTYESRDMNTFMFLKAHCQINLKANL